MDSLPNFLSDQILATSSAGKSKASIALPPSYYRLNFPLVTNLLLLLALALVLLYSVIQSGQLMAIMCIDQVLHTGSEGIACTSCDHSSNKSC